MDEVLVVGAGPAGSVAATLLARAGVRVRLLDRSSFPRDKLCGDTVNPGTLAILRRLALAAPIDRAGMAVDGMIVTGPGRASFVSVEGRYPRGLSGRAILRRELDQALVEQAIAAGAAFEPGLPVRRAALGDRSGACVVDGVAVGVRDGVCTLRARAIIAADGRRSVLAFGLGLTRHPVRPRRWAIGGYFESAGPRASQAVSEVGSEAALGEMHIRAGRYIGVAPVANGSVNVCVVKPSWPGDRAFGDPEMILRCELAADPLLRDRFAGARLVARPVVLGPLAVEATAPASAIPAGLVLAGDAAGFIDPMTGDGLRFAVRGGELAARAVLRALEHGWPGVHARLAEERRLDFASKWRFNRAVRALVAWPLALHAAAGAARVAPAALRALVARAGDCNLVP